MTKEKSTPGGKPAIPDNEIIERFGGIRPMASKLGVAVTTVQGWKERGHIPEGRLPQILKAAAEHDVDIELEETPKAEPAEPPVERVAPEPGPVQVEPKEIPKEEPKSEPEPSPTPEPEKEPELAAETAPGRAETKIADRHARGVSWGAFLAIVLLLGAAILTGPLWQSRLYPASGAGPAIDTGRLNDIAAGLTEVETGLADMTRDLEARESGLSARIDALEAGGGETGAAFADQLAGIEQGLDGLKSGLSAIDTRIAGLEAQQGKVPESVTTALDAADVALGDLRGKIAELGRETASLNERLSSIDGDVGGLDGRVSELEARPVQSGEKIAALVLALGQVEAAMNSGRPYRDALDRLEFLGRDDPLISGGEALAALSPWADYGIPDRLALRRRFIEIAPEIDRTLSGANEEGWLDSVWNSISGLVTIRRIDGADLTPLAQAEQALEEGDLASVKAAFEGKGPLGPDGEAWMNLVSARIEAEREIDILYGQMVAPLAGNGTAGAAGQ